MRDVRDMEAEAARIAAMTSEERTDYDRQLLAHRIALGLEESPAVQDIIAERARQVTEEGWTTGHDDEHAVGQMSLAAAAYATYAASQTDASLTIGSMAIKLWPWETHWWKPKDPRRNLVRAAALIIAEIERLDRKHSASGEQK